jgi:hypothetical protein
VWVIVWVGEREQEKVEIKEGGIFDWRETRETQKGETQKKGRRGNGAKKFVKKKPTTQYMKAKESVKKKEVEREREGKRQSEPGGPRR